MKFIYNFLLHISELLLRLFGNFFGLKIHQFSQGQKSVFKKLINCNLKNKKTIWFHVSSLGEYEQALPVIEKIKHKHTDYHIVLSFFSPSGYEIKKNSTPADCVVYLPIDTLKNVRKFLNIVQPKMVFFVKYDFWPNYLFELKKRNISTYLISGLFDKKHKFFKKNNLWLKKSLFAFTRFFVQDENSKKILLEQGFKNITVVGDTRFDRVYSIATQQNELDFVKKFKKNECLFIAGSTWKPDEELIFAYLKKNQNFKTIIAPHSVDEKHINNIKKQLKIPYILYSQINNSTDLSKYKIMILNTIGILNKTYRYADWVYIGGGFGKSIHNIQEPAVFGVPIITGKKIDKFKEAVDLEQVGGLIKVSNFYDFNKAMNLLYSDKISRLEKGKIIEKYVLKNVGATDKIINNLQAEF